MATATLTRRTESANANAGTDGITPFRLTVRQFEKMMDAGILTDQDHVELLGGVLAAQMTKYSPHNFAVGQFGDILRVLLAPDWIINEEKPIVLGKLWRPEPDISVARGPRSRYRQKDPNSVDLSLLVEVSDSSYPVDRGVKWVGYAAAKVPAYWIVNLAAKTIEVYTSPAGRGTTARYREAATFGMGQEVPVVVEGKQRGKIAVNEILS